MCPRPAMVASHFYATCSQEKIYLAFRFVQGVATTLQQKTDLFPDLRTSLMTVRDVQELSDEIELLVTSSVGNPVLQNGNMVTTIGGLTKLIEGQGSYGLPVVDNMETSDRLSAFSKFSDLLYTF